MMEADTLAAELCRRQHEAEDAIAATSVTRR